MNFNQEYIDMCVKSPIVQSMRKKYEDWKSDDIWLKGYFIPRLDQLIDKFKILEINAPYSDTISQDICINILCAIMSSKYHKVWDSEIKDWF